VIFQTQDTPGPNRDTGPVSNLSAKAEIFTAPPLLEKRMIARIQRLELTVWEMLVVAILVGLVAATFVALPVG